jgi:hypothetical protein
MKEQELESPSRLTKNVKLPPEVRASVSRLIVLHLNVDARRSRRSASSVATFKVRCACIAHAPYIRPVRLADALTR